MMSLKLMTLLDVGLFTYPVLHAAEASSQSRGSRRIAAQSLFGVSEEAWSCAWQFLHTKEGGIQMSV